MINLHMSTVISRPVKQVFDFVSASENDVKWQYGTLMAAQLPDGVDRLGSFFRSIGHLLGRRYQGIFEVTEYKPSRKYKFKSLSGPQLKENLALLKNLLEAQEMILGSIVI